MANQQRHQQAKQQICLCGGAPTGIRTNGDWSRLHGWSLPLHPLQGVAFLFLAMFALLHFGVLVPSLPHHSSWKLAATIVISIVFVVHVVVLLTCMSLNPGDPNVRFSDEGEAGTQGSKTFDRSKRPHVILDQYCCICQVKVGIKSKHCSSCNKCISEFDHHCKWLNNCIGGRNYKLFLVCVGSALIGCVVILVTSLSLVTAYFFRDSWLNQPLSLRVYENSTRMASPETGLSASNNASHPSSLHYREGRVFWVFLPVTGSLWLLVVALTSLLSLLACALLAHLLAFHAYLISQGLSTYEYIVQKRELTNNSGQSGHIGSHGTGGRLLKKGLLCPLKKWRRFKMTNQILPVTNKEDNKGKDSEISLPDLAKNGCSLQNVKSVISNTDKLQEERGNVSPTSSSGSSNAQMQEKQTPEQRAGDIYLGSPLRRARNLLPPIGFSDLNKPLQSSSEGNAAEMVSKKEDPDQLQRKEMTEPKGSPLKEQSCSSMALSSVPSLLEDERLDDADVEDPSPPPLPINLCSRHLSVSSQSLNNILKDETSSAVDILADKQLLDSQPHLSGSLSNLLILDNTQMDEEDLDKISIEDVVHEVSIIQSPFHEPRQEQLLFCPGKRRLSRLTGGSLGDLSPGGGGGDCQQPDVSVSDMCSLDPNYAEELCQGSTPPCKRRPSVDVLVIPLGNECLNRNSFVEMDHHNESTIIILHTDSKTQSNIFPSKRRTNFLTDASNRVHQQLIV